MMFTVVLLAVALVILILVKRLKVKARVNWAIVLPNFIASN